MNLLLISGRVVNDLELKEYKKDKFLCSFTIANNVFNGEEEKTNFLRCVMFGRAAESFVKYNEKGDSVLLRGRLDLDSYENEDEETIYTTQLIVESWEMGLRKKKVDRDPWDEMGEEVKPKKSKSRK